MYKRLINNNMKRLLTFIAEIPEIGYIALVLFMALILYWSTTDSFAAYLQTW
jgi:hypothetical protein